MLLVDDEDFFLKSLALSIDRLSTEHGFEVLTAPDGKAAIELLEHNVVDVVVTDVQMPHVNGLELLAYIGRSCPMTSVVIMTAFGTQDVRHLVSASGRGTYIEKPIDLDVLENILVRELNAKRGHVEGISLATFLQIVAAENMACTLSVSSDSGFGTLYCRGGAVVHAETQNLSGLDAALNIAAWQNTSVDIRSLCDPPEETINFAIPHLLLEAFRLEDEKERHRKSEGIPPFGEPILDANKESSIGPNEQQMAMCSPPLDAIQPIDAKLAIDVDCIESESHQHTQNKEVLEMATEKQINAILEKLDHIEGSHGGTLMSADGMVIATRLDKKFAADKVGALSSDVVRIATKVVTEAQFGTLDNMIIEGTEGKLCLINASRGGFFITIIGDRSLNVGMARMSLQEAIAEFDKLV